MSLKLRHFSNQEKGEILDNSEKKSDVSDFVTACFPSVSKADCANVSPWSGAQSEHTKPNEGNVNLRESLW